MKTSHALQIDVLKGLAIICVLLIHTVGITSTQMKILANWSFGQAVPVFICIMGVTMGLSFTRRGASTLRELFSTAYFARRFDRIVYPVLLLILVEVVYGAIFFVVRGSNRLVVTPRILLGWLPITGPGNDFISMAIAFIFVFPLIYYGYRRAPRFTLITCFVVNVAFVLVGLYAQWRTGNPMGSFFWYNANILRFVALIALGLWIADRASALSQRDRLLLVGGAIGLFVLLLDSGRLLWSLLIDARQVALFNAPVYLIVLFVSLLFYAALLVLLGIKFLPRTGTNPLVRALARTGRFSYHIFLVQIVYFALLAPTLILTIRRHVHGHALMAIELIVNVAVCIALGIGFALFEGHSKRALRAVKRAFVPSRGAAEETPPLT